MLKCLDEGERNILPRGRGSWAGGLGPSADVGVYVTGRGRGKILLGERAWVNEAGLLANGCGALTRRVAPGKGTNSGREGL